MQSKQEKPFMFTVNESYLENDKLELRFTQSKKRTAKLVKHPPCSKPTDDEHVPLAILLLLSVLLMLQIAFGIGSYSGKGRYPLFGDYEAQRHWMEITYNLPVRDWYRNTTDNDLEYWGLDYPPLTAYHSYLMGAVAHKINPDWVELHGSRGIETVQHKQFMRFSVIIGFFLIYVPAVIYATSIRTNANIPQMAHLILFLLYPGLLSIDNGHFQYNSISLGLVLAAYCFLVKGSLYLGSFAFVLALNYKQMELYHSLPIFAFILGRCTRRPFFGSIFSTVGNILRIGIVVVVTFAVVWSPIAWHGLSYVALALGRIFPFSRGLYEDKVASVWCAFSWLLKWNQVLSTQNQIRLSSLLVLSSSLPSLVILFLRPSPRFFRLVLFIVALNFFLFSFQVHEKSVLLVALPALLLLSDYPSFAVSFLHISNTSLFSLCVKDDNWLHLLVFVCYFIVSYEWVLGGANGAAGSSIWLGYLSVVRGVVGVVLCLAELCLSPPIHLPHLFPLLSAFYSCCCFLLDLVLANYFLVSSYLIPVKTKTL